MQAAAFTEKGVDGFYCAAFIAQLDIGDRLSRRYGNGDFGFGCPSARAGSQNKVAAAEIAGTLIFMMNLS